MAKIELAMASLEIETDGNAVLAKQEFKDGVRTGQQSRDDEGLLEWTLPASNVYSGEEKVFQGGITIHSNTEPKFTRSNQRHTLLTPVKPFIKVWRGKASDGASSHQFNFHCYGIEAVKGGQK